MYILILHTLYGLNLLVLFLLHIIQIINPECLDSESLLPLVIKDKQVVIFVIFCGVVINFSFYRVEDKKLQSPVLVLKKYQPEFSFFSVNRFQSINKL